MDRGSEGRRGKQRRKSLKGFDIDSFEMNIMLFFYEDSTNRWLTIEPTKFLRHINMSKVFN